MKGDVGTGWPSYCADECRYACIGCFRLLVLWECRFGVVVEKQFSETRLVQVLAWP